MDGPTNRQTDKAGHSHVKRNRLKPANVITRENEGGDAQIEEQISKWYYYE